MVRPRRVARSCRPPINRMPLPLRQTIMPTRSGRLCCRLPRPRTRRSLGTGETVRRNRVDHDRRRQPGRGVGNLLSRCVVAAPGIARRLGNLAGRGVRGARPRRAGQPPAGAPLALRQQALAGLRLASTAQKLSPRSATLPRSIDCPTCAGKAASSGAAAIQQRVSTTGKRDAYHAL